MFLKFSFQEAILSIYARHYCTGSRAQLSHYLPRLLYDALYVQLFFRAILSNFLSERKLAGLDYFFHYAFYHIMKGNRITQFAFTVLMLYPCVIEVFMTIHCCPIFEPLFDDVYHMIGMIKKNRIDFRKWIKEGFLGASRTQIRDLAKGLEIRSVVKCNFRSRVQFIVVFKAINLAFRLFAMAVWFLTTSMFCTIVYDLSTSSSSLYMIIRILLDSFLMSIVFHVALLDGITVVGICILYGALLIPLIQDQTRSLQSKVLRVIKSKLLLSLNAIKQIRTFYETFVVVLSKMVMVNQEVIARTLPLTVLSNILSNTSFIVSFFVDDYNSATTMVLGALVGIPFAVLLFASLCLIQYSDMVYHNSARILKCHQKAIAVETGSGESACVRVKLSTIVEVVHTSRQYRFSFAQVGKLSRKSLLDFFCLYSALVMYLIQLQIHRGNLRR